jgi:hypothetical protein
LKSEKEGFVSKELAGLVPSGLRWDFETKTRSERKERRKEVRKLAA